MTTSSSAVNTSDRKAAMVSDVARYLTIKKAGSKSSKMVHGVLGSAGLAT